MLSDLGLDMSDEVDHGEYSGSFQLVLATLDEAWCFLSSSCRTLKV